MIIRPEFRNNKITLEQTVSLFKLYDQYNHTNQANGRAVLKFETWLEQNISIPSYDTCVMVSHNGMMLGIEEDGYTHS